jgi:N-acetylglutamate synthase-like GNAT family acetyltransferase
VSRVTVHVRPAELSDVDGLTELIGSTDVTSGVFSGRAMLDQSVGHLSARLSEIIQERSRSLLVATDDASGDLVGLLVAKCDEIGAIDLTPVLHVTHLLVAPGHRRRGVGRTLLTAAVHLAEEHDMDRVLATAASGSREANRYLARIGFAPMVVHRLAPTSVLRRSLGMAEAPERMAVLRRARLARIQRAGFGPRVARRGA